MRPLHLPISFEVRTVVSDRINSSGSSSVPKNVQLLVGVGAFLELVDVHHFAVSCSVQDAVVPLGIRLLRQVGSLEAR